MNQLTIRGFDDDLRHEIEALARARSISLNKAAVVLMRGGAGLDGGVAHSKVIGDTIDEFMETGPEPIVSGWESPHRKAPNMQLGRAREPRRFDFSPSHAGRRTAVLGGTAEAADWPI